jgi:hypothetical protein
LGIDRDFLALAKTFRGRELSAAANAGWQPIFAFLGAGQQTAKTAE